MIRAKFKCLSVTRHEGNCEVVTFAAANGSMGSANAQWSKWTPNGSLNMTINNPEALGRFAPGKFYFLDFAEAAEEA